MAARNPSQPPTSTPAAPDADRSGAALALVLALVIVSAIVGTTWARRHTWLPPVASVHGATVDRLFIATFIIISAAFILVQGLLALFIWLFRDRPGRSASYWHDHRGLELLYTLIPAIVMAALTLVAAGIWTQVHGAVPANALVVEVRAEQFGWRARYPGADGRFGRIDSAQFTLRQNPMALDRNDAAALDDIVASEVHLVAGRPVQVRLRSKDVLHSFFLPAFRVKQDAVPGMTVPTTFTPTRAGTYQIACAELCGVGHFAMRGVLVVQTQAEFDAWLSQQAPALR